MNTKHTPGPWIYVSRNMDESANWASRIPFAIEAKYQGMCVPVADVTANPIVEVCDQPVAEANARLIAAAPLMHRALEAHAAWHWAESNSGSSTFHERMELANYSQWLTARALSQAAGIEDKEDFSGVPKLLLGFDGARIDRASEQTAEQIVARLIVLYRYAVTTA